jgi:hypothetical protein
MEVKFVFPPNALSTHLLLVKPLKDWRDCVAEQEENAKAMKRMNILDMVE